MPIYPNLISNMEHLTEDLRDIGRAVYYAKSYNDEHNVNVHLDRILNILGITEPGDVGLSNSVLKKN